MSTDIPHSASRELELKFKFGTGTRTGTGTAKKAVDRGEVGRYITVFF